MSGDERVFALLGALFIIGLCGAVLRCQVVTEHVLMECLHTGHSVAECKDMKP